MKSLTSIFSLRKLLLIASLMFSVSAARGGNFYVAATGSNSNDGSIASPWATLLYAASKVQAGDTIFVRGGTYTEGEIWIRQDYGMGGREGKYVTIAAFADENPIFTNGSRGLIIDASYVRVMGLDFRNGKEMYNVNWAGPTDHVELINNHFSGTPSYAAIEIIGEHNLIEGNFIELAGNTVGTQGHGIYASQGAHTIIRNNFISGATGYGIHLYVEEKSQNPAEVYAIKDILIEKNFTANSQQRSGIIVAAGGGREVYIDSVIIRNNVMVNNAISGIVLNGWSEVRNIQIYHNTVYGNAGNAIQIYQTVKDVAIKNNIICAESGMKHIDNAPNAPGIVVERNLYNPAPHVLNHVEDTSFLEGDPLFSDPDHNDFTLRKGSIAIDAGVYLGLPYKGMAPDLGAFEFDPATGIRSGAHNVPRFFELYQNFPNPLRASNFKTKTIISYKIPFDAFIDLSVFNLLGQRVRTLVQDRQAAGLNTAAWDGLDEQQMKVAMGVYLYSLVVDGHSLNKKMIIIE